MSDLQAQIAANQKGISLVNELAGEFGVGVVQRWGGVGGWGGVCVRVRVCLCVCECVLVCACVCACVLCVCLN